jgi:hypothetical protein
MSIIWEVAVQGRFNRAQWVYEFDVLTSENGKNWTVALQEQRGPESCDDIVYVAFDKPMAAQYVRIVPKKWSGWISLRFDVRSSEIQPDELHIMKLWDMNSLSDEELKEITQTELHSIFQHFQGDFGIK